MKFFQSASVFLGLLQSSLAGGVRIENHEQRDRFAGVKSDTGRFNGRVLGGSVLEYHRYYHPEISGPVVFVMTGRSSRYTQMIDIAKELASRGYTAILFEHFSYSSKKRDAKVTGPPSTDYPTHMYKTMQNSMDDIDWMIHNHEGAFVARLPNPSSALTFAVLGVSMGGHASQLTFANNPSIDAGVCFVCQGNYEHYMSEKFLPYLKQSSPVWDDWFPQELANDVRKLDPINHFQDFNKRPFLAINDYDDAQVPAIVNYEMIKNIRDQGYYSGSDHTKLHHEITRSGKGHDAHKQPYLQKFAVNWLEEHFPVNKQSGVLSEGRYKIVVSDDTQSSFTVHQPFLYISSGSNYLRAAGWMKDNSWVYVPHIWEVSSVQGVYTIKNNGRYICADPTGHYTHNMAGVGRKDWYFTPLRRFSSAYCVWKIIEVGEKPGSYQIINVHHSGKLLLSNIKDSHSNYKLFTIPGHNQVVGGWENDLFTFHALKNDGVNTRVEWK